MKYLNSLKINNKNNFFLFSLQLFDLKNNKKKNFNFLYYLNSTDVSLINKQINFFIKSGKKTIISTIFYSYLNFFFCELFEKNSNLNYKYIKELKSAINTNLFLRNSLFLFNWYITHYKFLFNLKNEIKKQGKNEKKSLKATFLNHRQRVFFFLRWLFLFSKLDSGNKLKKKIFNSFNDIFLNFKESKLYKYKIFVYKKVFYI